MLVRTRDRRPRKLPIPIALRSLSGVSPHVPHAHLRLQHLLKQQELALTQPPRPRRPAWILTLVDAVADIFEPCTGVARVGYDCQAGPDRWEIGLYLGKTELVGGAVDGSAEFVNFHFNVLDLLNQFSRVERCAWHALPQRGPGEPGSFLVCEGVWQEHPVRLQFFALPPDSAGPGLRRYPDGSCEPA